MKYSICMTRHYYGPKSVKTRLTDESNGHEWTGTHAAARAKIAKLDAEVYYTSHNEFSRPDYTIVKA